MAHAKMNTKTLEWLLAREHHRGWSERDEEVAALKREKAELQLELAKVTEELVRIVAGQGVPLGDEDHDREECEPWCRMEGGHGGRCLSHCETALDTGERCTLPPHHNWPCRFC